MEEEFNAWYDTEHLAERLAIPGFLSAQRWVADVAPGGGKYLTSYELESAEVLRSPAYVERYNNQTPWSRRCLAKMVVFKRWLCAQIEPGNAELHPATKALLLNQVTPNSLQVRRFRAQDGAVIALCELAAPPAKGLAYRRYQP
jgi:hypothetical protein